MYNTMVLGTGSQWAYLRLWDPDPQPHKIRTLRPPLYTHYLHTIYTLSTQAGACLQYGGRLLEQLFRARPRRCAPAAVFPAPAAAASLWSAKLFTAHTSMSESFKQTVQLVSSLLSQVCSGVIHYSYLLSVIYYYLDIYCLVMNAGKLPRRRGRAPRPLQHGGLGQSERLRRNSGI